MPILWFFHSYTFVLFSKKKNCNNFFKWPQNKKNKVTLYHETLKVDDNKVPLFFHLEAIWRSYSQFVIFGGLRPYHQF